MKHRFYLFLAVIFLALPLRAEESSVFKIVLLPDTQVYARAYPDTFYAQTKWIADNADSIAFMLHQGDITDNNTPAQWNVAVFSIKLLDGKVPYSLTQGNHDLGTRGSTDTRDSTLMNRFFPYAEYSKQKGFGGTFESGKIDNNWLTFRAGGVDWLVISLEFGPRDKVLDWAAALVEKHPKHRVIVNTHAYMYSDDRRMQEGHNWLPQKYPIGKNAGADMPNDGEGMWNKFVSKYPNILFVFSGHVLNDGTGLLVDKGEKGNNVYQILANYQMKPKGGEGYLRLMTFDTKKKTVDVKTYSPLLNKYDEAEDQQFVLKNVDFGR